MLRCPICKSELVKEDKQYRCVYNHSFDQAKQGYVNLSLKQKKRQGDDADMVHARTTFLEKDYYAFMREYVADLLEKYEITNLVDCGCGQGYYTKAFAQQSDCIGIDLSKSAISYAARQDKKSQYVVASIFDMPVIDGWADGVTSIFVPDADTDVSRVLKNNGYWITVGPGPKHCWGLKNELYETPYINKPAQTKKAGFELVQQETITHTQMVQDVYALFAMTPYFYKTSQIASEKIKQIKELQETFEFVVTVWRKQ